MLKRHVGEGGMIDFAMKRETLEALEEHKREKRVDRKKRRKEEKAEDKKRLEFIMAEHAAAMQLKVDENEGLRAALKRTKAHSEEVSGEMKRRFTEELNDKESRHKTELGKRDRQILLLEANMADAKERLSELQKRDYFKLQEIQKLTTLMDKEKSERARAQSEYEKLRQECFCNSCGTFHLTSPTRLRMLQCEARHAVCEECFRARVEDKIVLGWFRGPSLCPVKACQGSSTS